MTVPGQRPMASEKENMQAFKTLGAAFFAVGLVCAEFLASGCGAAPEDEPIGKTEEPLIVVDGGFGTAYSTGGRGFACVPSSVAQATQQCMVPGWEKSDGKIRNVAWGVNPIGSSADASDIRTAFVAAQNQLNTDLNGVEPYSFVFASETQSAQVWAGTWGLPAGSHWGTGVGNGISRNVSFFNQPPSLLMTESPALTGKFYGIASAPLYSGAGKFEDVYIDVANLKTNCVRLQCNYRNVLIHIAENALLKAIGVGSSGDANAMSGDSMLPELKPATLTGHEHCMLDSVVPGSMTSITELANYCP